MSAFFGWSAPGRPRDRPTFPTVRIPGREAPLLADVDVVVAGGGPAGLAAAVAAARDGASTVLCERYGFLGGNLTVASVGTICGLYRTDGPGEFTPVVGGLAREVTDRLAAAGAGLGPLPFKETAVFVYTPWAAKRLADDLVASEENLDVLLHAPSPLVTATTVWSRWWWPPSGAAGVRSRLRRLHRDAEPGRARRPPDGARAAGARQHASMQFTIQNVDSTAAVPRCRGSPTSRRARPPHARLGALIPTLPPRGCSARCPHRQTRREPDRLHHVRQATAGEDRGPPPGRRGRGLPARSHAGLRGRVPLRHRHRAGDP